MTCSMSRAPSSMSSTAIGSGATNGAGIVWFTTKVCTGRRARPATGSSFGPPQAMHVRVDRRGRADRAAVDAAAGEQAEHLVGAAHEQRALGRHAHRDRLARRDELAARAQHLGVRRRLAAGERVHDERRARDRCSTSTSTPVVRPPPVPTNATCPARRARRWRRATAPPRRCRRPRRTPRPTPRVGADVLRDHRAEPAVGVGERPRAHVERRERARDLGRRPAGRSPRGTAGRRRDRGRRPRRRRGSGRGTDGCASRARRARPCRPVRPSTTAAAPAPQRASNPVPGPGRSASDATTSAMRADPAATASAAAVSASIPACVEPARSAPPTCGRAAKRGAEHAGSVLPRTAGGRFPRRARRLCGSMPAAVERGSGRFPREREGVLVGWTHRRVAATAACPTPRRRRPPPRAGAVPRPDAEQLDLSCSSHSLAALLSAALLVGGSRDRGAAARSAQSEQ